MSSQREQTKILSALMEKSCNNYCIDCGESAAANVDCSHYTFCCVACSAVHREIGDKIKSVGVSSFSKEEMDQIQRHSNDEFNNLWMSSFKRGDQPLLPGSNDATRRSFIQAKYLQKRWHKNTPKRAQRMAFPTEDDSDGPSSVSKEPMPRGDPFAPKQRSGKDPFSRTPKERTRNYNDAYQQQPQFNQQQSTNLKSYENYEDNDDDYEEENDYYTPQTRKSPFHQPEQFQQQQIPQDNEFKNDSIKNSPFQRHNTPNQQSQFPSKKQGRSFQPQFQQQPQQQFQQQPQQQFQQQPQQQFQQQPQQQFQQNNIDLLLASSNNATTSNKSAIDDIFGFSTSQNRNVPQNSPSLEEDLFGIAPSSSMTASQQASQPAVMQPSDDLFDFSNDQINAAVQQRQAHREDLRSIVGSIGNDDDASRQRQSHVETLRQQGLGVPDSPIFMANNLLASGYGSQQRMGSPQQYGMMPGQQRQPQQYGNHQMYQQNHP